MPDRHAVPPHVPVRDDLEPHRRRDYRVARPQTRRRAQIRTAVRNVHDVVRAWTHLDRSIRINYSTIILGLRVNVWTAIIVFLAGCILFVVLWRFGSETRDLTSRLRAVTADEMERQRQLEERAAAKSGKTAKTAKPETPAETAESEIHQD